VTGTTPPSTAGSNFIPSCNTSTTSTEDVYHYPLSRDLTTLTFSTVGSTGDTVTSVRFDMCGVPAAELACNHVAASGEEVTINSPALGDYFVFVDGDFVSAIDYVLNVKGTIGLGGPCVPGDTQFTCEASHLCDIGTNLCRQTDCSNGVDDDGDALIDDFDPGCTGIDDDSENPDPSPLPECADGVDRRGVVDLSSARGAGPAVRRNHGAVRTG